MVEDTCLISEGQKCLLHPRLMEACFLEGPGCRYSRCTNGTHGMSTMATLN